MPHAMKWVLYVAALLLLAQAIVAVRPEKDIGGSVPLRRASKTHAKLPVCNSCPLDHQAAERAVARFSKLLQFETVSDRDVPHHVRHPDAFVKLHEYLKLTYPNIWGNLTVDTVGDGGHSLLLEWTGQNAALTPLLFISHLDVVPVAEETLDQWTYPPFSGAIAEGFIWGRGALDVKVGVAGLLEAISLLLEEGWQPERTILLGFGQDEEVGGDLGAGATAKLLQDRGVNELDAVLDEGSVVFVDGFHPYTDKPVALIATAEKGYYSVKVHVAGKGGHSSVPPIDHTSAATEAAKLLLALDASPPPGALVSPITEFLQAIAPLVDTPWLQTLFLHPDIPANAERILNNHLLKDNDLTAALARTTAAVTGVQGYVGDNVLPPTVTVNINFRLLPGDTTDDVLSYLNGLIETLGLNVTITPSRPDAPPDQALATPVTSSTGRHFKAVKTALQEIMANDDGSTLVVAPYMLTGGTDSKHYLPLSKGGVLRFVPVTASLNDKARVHGLNERLSVEGYTRAICAYRRVLELTASE